MAQALGDLPVGSLVIDPKTKYNRAVIVWRVEGPGNEENPKNSVILTSRDIISLKCFDAREPFNSDPDRIEYGNNRYSQSNILQWLNSDTEDWFYKQHERDMDPKNMYVFGKFNEYAREGGFLRNISNALKYSMLNIKQKMDIPEVDGGDSEIIMTRIFIQSEDELGDELLRKPTEQALDRSEFKNRDALVLKAQKRGIPIDEINEEEVLLSKDLPWSYWIRSSNTSTSQMAKVVTNEGTIEDAESFRGYHGVVPAFALFNTTLVSDEPNEDGYYEFIFGKVTEEDEIIDDIVDEEVAYDDVAGGAGSSSEQTANDGDEGGQDGDAEQVEEEEEPEVVIGDEYVLVRESRIRDIASAINQKKETDKLYRPCEFATAIRNIRKHGVLKITEESDEEYDVSTYEYVWLEIPEDEDDKGRNVVSIQLTKYPDLNYSYGDVFVRDDYEVKAIYDNRTLEVITPQCDFSIDDGFVFHYNDTDVLNIDYYVDDSHFRIKQSLVTEKKTYEWVESEADFIQYSVVYDHTFLNRIPDQYVWGASIYGLSPRRFTTIRYKSDGFDKSTIIIASIEPFIYIRYSPDGKMFHYDFRLYAVTKKKKTVYYIVDTHRATLMTDTIDMPKIDEEAGDPFNYDTIAFSMFDGEIIEEIVDEEVVTG